MIYNMIIIIIIVIIIIIIIPNVFCVFFIIKVIL